MVLPDSMGQGKGRRMNGPCALGKRLNDALSLLATLSNFYSAGDLSLLFKKNYQMIEQELKEKKIRETDEICRE